MAGPELCTERLRLRRWRDDDRAPFAELNADPEVMKYFPGALTRAQSDAFVDRIEAHFGEQGFGLWVVEVRDESSFIGFVGLSVPGFEADFTPCVEIGWRIARASWGNGYAPEAARAALRFGFDELGLERIVSFTAVGNANSRRVMEKIGMRYLRDFDHPDLPPEHPLCAHALYATERQGGTGTPEPARG